MTPREERGGYRGKERGGWWVGEKTFFIHSDHGLVGVVVILCLGNGCYWPIIFDFYFF